MNIFYEEDGGFKIGALVQEAEASLQVESISGKRSKIKSALAYLRFDEPLNGWLEAAQQEADTLDLTFLWEASQLLDVAEFHFNSLAEAYYGKPTTQQCAAMALKVHSAPIYFNRKGKGSYKAAAAETLQAALAGLEKKRLQAEQATAWIAQLLSGDCPNALREKAKQLTYAPDKNTLEWKALEQAAQQVGKSTLELMLQVGLVNNPHDYHLGAFLFEMFRNGTDFPAEIGHSQTVKYGEDLPFSDAQAFSIDDSSTTEIDDAFSVRQLPNGLVEVGIHIAAPAMAVLPNSALDAEVAQRLSTVYMPGHKITMLPEAAIRPFSLDAGEIKPALSLYVQLDAAFEIVAHRTVLEQISIADNLRHDTLEPFFNAQTLAEDSGHPYWQKLKYLFDWAESLEKARGKYDPNRPPQIDYNFYVTEGRVQIVPRERGAPMDKLVAELMIFANSHWGGLLKEAHYVGLYRAQTGGKVFMSLQAEPHQGLGVAQYAWSTSPLRRAVDLINQRQLMALVMQQPSHYSMHDADLKHFLRKFELTYSSYAEFQTRMERFWCLQYLIQENLSEIQATVWRENLVRLEGMFLLTKVPLLPALKTGTLVKLRIRSINLLLIELETAFVEVVQESEIEAILTDDAEF